MYTIIPKELKEMQGDWFKPGEVPEVLEERIRFNSTSGKLGKKDYIMDNLSGGGGTVIIKPADKEELAQFKEQADKHYYKDKYSKEHEDKLRAFLEEKGVELRIEGEDTNLRKGILRDILSIYSILPAHHFGHKHFKELRIGGWGSNGAKCSQYEDPTVHMFQFVLNGAKRNFRGLLLHETGHAVYENLRQNDVDLDYKLHTWASHMQKQFTMDYLWGKEERFKRLISSSHEMAAESYLLYVANGKRMKEFMSGLSGNERKAWENLYDMHLKSFNGMEYL